MATLTSNPTTTREGVTIIHLCAWNPLVFTFTAGTGETWIKIRLVNGATVLATLKARPFDNNDTCSFDVSPFAQSLITLADYTDNARLQSGYIGAALSTTFSLEYQTEVVTSWTAIGATRYSATASAQPLGNSKGSTLAEYVPLLSGSPLGVDFAGAFLTRFERPVLWYYADGASVSVWQPALAFPLVLADYTKIQIIRSRWYNGNTLSATQLSDDAGTSSPVVALGINQAETYVASNTSLVVDCGLDAGGSTMGDVAVSAITFDIKQACNNPYALKWLNTLGGFDVWVFEGRAPRTLTVESEYGQFGVRVDSIATATTTRNTYAREAVQELELFADQLALNQVQALQEILYSPIVRLFVGPLTAGTAFDKWHTVVVNEGDFQSYDTYDPKYKLSLSVMLPEIYHIDN